MFKFLSVFLCVSSIVLSQEITANSAAVEPSLAEQIMNIIISGLAVLIGWLVKSALPLLNAYLKDKMHFRGASVVADSITEVITTLSVETQGRLKDGELCKEDIKAIKEKAKVLATEKLKNLSGFYKKDLVKWVEEQIDVALGKLILLTSGK